MYALSSPVLRSSLMARTPLPPVPPASPLPDGRPAPPVGASPPAVPQVRPVPAGAAPPLAPPPAGPPPTRATLPAVIHEPSPVLDPPEKTVSESRMLPPHQTKLDRITGHLAAISGDLREWTELQVELVKRKVEGVEAQVDRVRHLLDSAPFFIGALVLAIIALLFFFVAVALGIGALVNSVGCGFAITTLLLFVSAVVLAWLGKRRVDKKNAEVAEARRLARQSDRRTVKDLQQSQAASVRNSAL